MDMDGREKERSAEEAAKAQWDGIPLLPIWGFE